MEEKGVRLNKALADAGICSRRRADELVFTGKVTVNGRIASSPGERVDPARDEITCMGQPVCMQEDRRSCWLMLNKPAGVVSTANDPEGRPTVLDYVPERFRSKRLYPVGRLDFFSEGLVLLTDDGELAHRMTHPRWHLPRVYEVRVRPDHGGNYITDKVLWAIRDGMTLAEGERLAPIEVQVLADPHSPSDPNDRDTRGVLLEMVLHQGLNRQIRRMCRDLEMTVLRLKRVEQGPLWIGDLHPGEVRELTEREILALRHAVGL